MTDKAMDIRSDANAQILEKVLLQGDLAQLTPSERLVYYREICNSLELNPLTRPFQYLKFQGRLILYATKDCTEQLARRDGISVRLDAGREFRDIWMVKATASADGRVAEATGGVSINGLNYEPLANALMKAETKASRRAVLRFAGLGMMDAEEVETLSGAEPIQVDIDTGEIAEQPSEIQEIPDPRDTGDLARCFLHKKDWVKDQFGARTHGNPSCEFKKMYSTLFAEACKRMGWKRSQLNDWMRDEFGDTTSKLRSRQLADAWNKFAPIATQAEDAAEIAHVLGSNKDYALPRDEDDPGEPEREGGPPPAAATSVSMWPTFDSGREFFDFCRDQHGFSSDRVLVIARAAELATDDDIPLNLAPQINNTALHNAIDREAIRELQQPQMM